MNKEIKGGKRRRWVRWCGYLGVAALALIGFAMVASLLSQQKSNRMLATEVARLEADGIQLDWRKLQPPTVADKTAEVFIASGGQLRSASSLRRAFPLAAALIGPGVFRSAIEPAEWRYMDVTGGRVVTNKATWDSLEQIFATHEADVHACREALTGRPPVFLVNYGDYPDLRLPQTSASIDVSVWLATDVLRNLRVKRADTAHGTLLALLHLSMAIADTKDMWSLVIAGQAQNYAWRTLQECQDRVDWTPEQWRQVQDGFLSIDWTANARAALDLETAAGWHLFEKIQKDITAATHSVSGSPADWWYSARSAVVDQLHSSVPDFGSWVGDRLDQGEEWWSERLFPAFWRKHWLPKDGTAFLQRSHHAQLTLRRLADDAALSEFVHTNDWDNWQAAFNDAAQARPHVFQISSMTGGVAVGEKFLGRQLVSQHRARLAAAVCAIQRHVLVNGAPPANLSALVPDYMSGVPIDPGDGQLLRYTLHTDGTWRLYSTGLDGLDDGGDGNPARGRSFDPSMAKDILWPRRATPDEVAAFEEDRAGQPAIGDGDDE